MGDTEVLAQILSRNESQGVSGATVAEGLTGSGEAAPKVMHPFSWQVSAGCCQEDSILGYTDHSEEQLECLYKMAAGFPQSEWPKRTRGRCSVFYNLALEATHLHFYNIFLQ